MAKFPQRTTAPETSNAYYYANNPFYQAGYGLPNCTCYAWGRFYELSGTRPNLCSWDAVEWYGYDDGYARGQTPKLGAVIVWAKGTIGDDSDGAGHVAIVEQINPDGSIVTSNSAWGGWTFYMEEIDNSYSLSGYRFLGFIYNPVNFDGSGDSYKPENPIRANRWLSLEEMQINAKYIAWYLLKRGWTLNAISGMLGNFQTESSINPGIWQNLAVDVGPAFGLAQWDPFTKYTSWCEENGLDPAAMDSALMRIEWELANGEQYYATSAYPETFAEFKVSTKNPYYLGMAFLANYERPAEPNQPARGEQAEYWYTYLSEIDFSGSGSGKKKRKKFNFILFRNKQWRNTV